MPESEPQANNRSKAKPRQESRQRTPSTDRERARDLKALFPEFVAQKREANEKYQPDLSLVLSEARLDLDYVLAGGGRPSSIRLGHVIREQSAGGQSS